MKRFSTIFYTICLISTLVSCISEYESEPRNVISEDYIWSDPTTLNAEYFISSIYATLPGGGNRLNGVALDCATDDAVPSDDGSGTWSVIRSGYSSTSTFDDKWATSYAGIRKANIFLANYQRVAWLDPLKKKWFPAEARFIRAIHYFELVKRYGGIPLIGDKVLTLTDDLNFPRNSVSECFQYLVSECDAIKDSLRTDPIPSTFFGRVGKAAALTLKTKVLLLAASPLYNTTNDLSKWKAAADAAKEVIDLGAYTLEANRYTLATARVNNENIFIRQGGSNANGYVYEVSPVGYRPGNTASAGRISPTQELVDAFGMKNGKAITEVGSGYDATNPYANRDPRLDQTIFYNGQTWLRRAVETFEGGQDKPNSTSIAVQTKTGYYSKKLLANDANSTTYSTVNGAWTIFRYADVLLMYAEALNEYAGPGAASTTTTADGKTINGVYDAVQAIRNRAGLVPYALANGLTQTQMRDIIRNERRVEFAFEEQRFWDIRRWKTAESVYGTTLHGVKITKNTAGKFMYEKIDVTTPFFASYMYVFPIDNAEILKNSKLIQNEGY
ncbi:RagB/SusD family nutrient uptake outer membrane protein [Arcicella lustrica]|uniref:RagB/SusD family nutrient uptake outer membrane protein n=1 Tax=Arcicella lustrica TaxID=2984196 RepID=A0ABU5SPT9_9BACT|nr:RagB/SusD family nutrient uptake outer membrane protein [Arcicella sp. DC25W]MEA5429285.1 RagB/SusD family nutrient uptake outer membrane protein [Arcicella sp. DC25W]